MYYYPATSVSSHETTPAEDDGSFESAFMAKPGLGRVAVEYDSKVFVLLG